MGVDKDKAARESSETDLEIEGESGPWGRVVVARPLPQELEALPSGVGHGSGQRAVRHKEPRASSLGSSLRPAGCRSCSCPELVASPGSRAVTSACWKPNPNTNGDFWLSQGFRMWHLLSSWLASQE